MDINDDGNIDLIGAGFAGLTYVLYGKADGSFKESEVLTSEKGKSLHLSKYYDFEKDWYVTLKEENGKVDKGDFAKFHDWDNDGDLDLIMSGGDVGGAYLFINKGSKSKPVFSSKYTKVTPAYFADAFVDWDGDGLWDIVGGSKRGGAYFYKNIGTLKSPKFEEAVCLFTSKEITKNIERTRGGGMTQIAVTDHNNDGKLDLVMGIHTLVVQPSPKLTKEQLKQKEQGEREYKAIHEKLNIYKDKFAKNRGITNPLDLKGALKDDQTYKDFMAASSKLYSEKVFPYKAKMNVHGRILVSIRK